MAKTRRKLNRMMQTGPYCAAALIVEKMLKESNPPGAAHNIPSLIRIVDKLTVGTTESPKVGDIYAFPVEAFFSVKGGDFKGECVFALHQIAPSGKRHPKPAVTTSLEFKSDQPPEFGYNINWPVSLVWETFGRYWLQVELDGVPLCRTAISVVQDPTPMVSKA